MNYDLTMKELMDIIQKALDGLKGKNVRKEGGISKLVESATSSIKEISLPRYNIEVKQCRFTMYCPGMDSDVVFADVKLVYKPDKRKWNGTSDILESVTIYLSREIPLEIEVLNVSQFLDYNVAKENFKRLEEQQKELLDEYRKNYEAMQKLQEVMKSEAYDPVTAKEAEEVKDILEDMYIK